MTHENSTFGGLNDWIDGIFKNAGSVKVGIEVFHPSYGKGIIEEVLGTGATVRVRVNFGFARPICLTSELAFQSENGQPHSSQTAPESASQKVETSPKVSDSILLGIATEPLVAEKPMKHKDNTQSISLKTMQETEVEARKGIVALRLGQVLESQVLELSVGMTTIRQKLRSAIAATIAGGPNFMILDAAWGGGKTHALTMLQAMAHETKFATAYVVMDGVSASFASPMELMSELMRSLRFPKTSRASDFSHQLVRAKQEERIEILEQRGACLIADGLNALPVQAFDDPEVLEILCDYFTLDLTASGANGRIAALGYRGQLKAIKAFKLADRPTRFSRLLGEWANFATALECNGLLIVFDELDVEYACSAFGTQRDNSTRSRRKELLMALGCLTKAPVLIAFAAAPGGPDLDPQNDPIHDILDCFGDKIEHIKVPSPDKRDFQLLLDRLLGIYGDAYDIESAQFEQRVSSELFEALFEHYQLDPSPVPRRFVRSAIESMDLLFGRPSYSIKDVFSTT